MIVWKINPIRNKLLLLGAGLGTGPYGFLFILTVFSHIFKGPLSIAFYFLSYCVLCFYLFWFYERKSLFIVLKSTRFSKQNIIVIGILLVYIITIVLFTNAATYGGDVDTYWSIATSFSRGNYPTVSPWQPNLLSVYHEGTFIIMGALASLARLNIPIIHFIFSAYLLVSLLFILTGLAREKSSSIISLLPAFLTIFTYGGPVLLISGFSNFLSQFGSSNIGVVLSNLSLNQMYIELLTSRGTGGNCGAWIGDFAFCNFRALGFVGLLVYLLILSYGFNKYSHKQSLILLCFIFLLASVDEPLLIVSGILFGIHFVYVSWKNFSIAAIIFRIIFITTTSVALFFIIQNPIRDSLLNPKPDIARFTLMNSSTVELKARFLFINALGSPQGWYLPDLKTLILISLLLLAWMRSRYSIFLFLSGIISLGMAYIFYDYYWPSNGRRLFFTTYHTTLLIFAFSLVELMASRVNFKKVGAIAFIGLFLPSTIVVHAKVVKAILSDAKSNFTGTYEYHVPVLDWITKNIPYSKRVIFIDDYPYNSASSFYSQRALVSYGLFVPIAPLRPKIMNVDSGGEWYDAITTLDPSSLKLLDVSYVYVKNSALINLPFESTAYLQDSIYFIPVYRDSEGVLYAVQQAYFKTKLPVETLQSITIAIPSNKVVYVDRFFNPEIRRELLLNLSKRDKTIGPMYWQGSDYFMHAEFIPPYTAVTDLQEGLSKFSPRYVFINPQNPQAVLLNEKYMPIITRYAVELWELK